MDLDFIVEQHPLRAFFYLLCVDSRALLHFQLFIGYALTLALDIRLRVFWFITQCLDNEILSITSGERKTSKLQKT